MTCAFDDPEDLSPVVANLYRSWHEQQGGPVTLLLVESFVLLDPWWTLALGAVPLWLKFAVQSSADRLERHLDEAEPDDDIALTLFSHGTDGVGVTPMKRWTALAGRARRRGRLLGVDPRRYPRDFAVFARFHTELRRLGPPRAMPAPLPLAALEPVLR
jgi:hypothetical protein